MEHTLGVGRRVAVLCLALGAFACDDTAGPLEASDGHAGGTDAGPDAAADIAIPDAAIPDAAIPDAAIPDAAFPDAGPDAAFPDAGPVELAARYDLEGDTLFPEGIAFDPSRRTFLLGSLEDGRVVRVDAAGQQTELVAPQTDWRTGGLAVDVDRRRLWICATPREQGPTSVVQIYDLDTRARVAQLDLGEAAAEARCNDLTLDADGRAYVTDPALPNVYRLTLAAEAVELWATDPALAATAPGLGLNGIAFTPNGRHLIVARYLPPALFRISASDPTEIAEITLEGAPFGGGGVTGPDGLVFLRGALYVVFAAEVRRITFDGAYLAGQVATQAIVAGLSTAAVAEDRLYVSKSHAVEWVLGRPPELPFQILEIDLDGFE